VKSLDALYIHELDAKAIRAHPKVVAFYEGLRSKSGEPTEISDVLSDKPKEQVILSDPGDLTGVAPDWLEVIEPLRAQPRWSSLTQAVQEARAKGPVYPDHDKVFAALRATPLSSVRVVILGQDPYPSPNHGNGLAFSVEPQVKPFPPSLRNIFKEAIDDLGDDDFPWPQTGDLTPWTKQGVLLINTTLTVDAGAPRSHAKFGWVDVVNTLLRAVIKQKKRVVFILWGKDAQAFKKYIDVPGAQQHVIIEGVHPSPLSASRGFFGSKPFSKVNDVVRGEPIIWKLP
jgi:uracil-DNA glycosylase